MNDAAYMGYYSMSLRFFLKGTISKNKRDKTSNIFIGLP